MSKHDISVAGRRMMGWPSVHEKNLGIFQVTGKRETRRSIEIILLFHFCDLDSGQNRPDRKIFYGQKKVEQKANEIHFFFLITPKENHQNLSNANLALLAPASHLSHFNKTDPFKQISHRYQFDRFISHYDQK